MWSRRCWPTRHRMALCPSPTRSQAPCAPPATCSSRAKSRSVSLVAFSILRAHILPLPCQSLRHKVCSEIHGNITLHLLAKCGAEEVRRIYSHRHALLECARNIREKFPKAECIEVTSTSKGAELAAKEVCCLLPVSWMGFEFTRSASLALTHSPSPPPPPPYPFP